MFPDAIARQIAAEAQAGDPSPSMPDDHEARLDFAARELAQEMHALRGTMLNPGDAGELGLRTVTKTGG